MEKDIFFAGKQSISRFFFPVRMNISQISKAYAALFQAEYAFFHDICEPSDLKRRQDLSLQRSEQKRIPI